MAFESFEEAESIGLAFRIILPLFFSGMLILSLFHKRFSLTNVYHYFLQVQFLRYVGMIEQTQSLYILEVWRGVDRSIRQFSPSTQDLDEFHSNFQRLGIDSPYLIENALEILALFLIYEIALGVKYIRLRKIEEADLQKKSILSNMIKGMLIAYYDLYLFSILDLYVFEYVNFYSLINHALAFLLLAILVAFTVFMPVATQLSLKFRTDNNINPIFQSYLQEFEHNSSPLHYLYYTLFLFLRTTIGVSNIILWKYSNTQLFLIIFIQALICAYLLCLRPFKGKAQNFLYFMIELCALLVILCNYGYSLETFDGMDASLNGFTILFIILGLLFCLLKYFLIDNRAKNVVAASTIFEKLPDLNQRAVRLDHQTIETKQETVLSHTVDYNRQPQGEYIEIYTTQMPNQPYKDGKINESVLKSEEHIESSPGKSQNEGLAYEMGRDDRPFTDILSSRSPQFDERTYRIRDKASTILQKNQGSSGNMLFGSSEHYPHFRFEGGKPMFYTHK